MELYKREYFISRIRSGYLRYKHPHGIIIVKYPTPEIEYILNETYIDVYEEALENGIIEDDYIYDMMITNEMWTEQRQKELDEIVPKHIEYWKKELYKAAFKSSQREKMRKYLEAAKNEFARLTILRHQYDHFTCAGVANYIKNLRMIELCSKWQDGRPISWQEVDINLVVKHYNDSKLSNDILRYLSRTTPWSTIWASAKERVFDCSSLTDEQQVIISWSKMYDRIAESPDCPSDDVIEDDDMLDGWLLIQREKREHSQTQQQAESIIGKSSKIANADDIMIPVDSAEDARKIHSLNDQRAANIKKRRIKEVQAKGKVKEHEFTDMRERRAIEMTQAYIQGLRNKKG